MRVIAFNLKLIKSSLLAASIAFVFGYALGAANWLKTMPSIQERTTKIPDAPAMEETTTFQTASTPPTVPAARAPDAPPPEEPSTFQTASTPPPVPAVATPMAVAAPEAMPLEKGTSRPPLPREDPRTVAQKLVGTDLPGDRLRRSTPEQLAGSRAPRRWPNPFSDF
jgi:hypothetical protein